jgi:O-antigen ligase
MNDFTEKSAHVAMTPFYNDHTSYGAMLAMFIPPLTLFTFGSGVSRQVKCVAFFMLLLFIIGLIFSYTRAAWLSMIGALGVFVVYTLRIRIVPILLMIGVVVALFFIYQTDIIIALRSDRYKNTKNRSVEQRIQSIANITTDASNTERLNRWSSAIRMFREKPFFGWGPGTYQFQYAPFQLSSEMTIISTRSGERGNAHSEYIGPLAEMGVLGLISVLGIVVTTLLTAGRLIYFTTNKSVKWFAVAIALGLITYFIHGVLNNFLDTDKASAPFWGFIAMLVALDIREKELKALEQNS